MSGGNAQKTLLLRVNLTLIERVVHATRTFSVNTGSS